MRGVYRLGLTVHQTAGGSSPHARGLPADLPWAHSWARIIPACAGFTTRAAARSTYRRDHPRMRGVYVSSASVRASGAGSSPHARGLPVARMVAAGVRRIIPACAGFTHPAVALTAVLTDHPRMRGVYGRATAAATRCSGSSPHARGLPGRPTAEPLEGRIIPACAGFTGARSPRVTFRGDHPRMRGVYCWPWPASPPPAGSSPHARGLLLCVLCVLRSLRIIPACAGFTTSTTSTTSTTRDHPRMRGVYSIRAGLPAGASGSSPHARGLRRSGP